MKSFFSTDFSRYRKKPEKSSEIIVTATAPVGPRRRIAPNSGTKSMEVVEPASVNRRYNIMARVLRASRVPKARRDCASRVGGCLTKRVTTRATAATVVA
ncbi:MAG: hypothetical protein M8866_02090 [marine benthic group bacterium]|nr:hypothetical protein [Candidatus Benthicola marisminoris]